ncbi:MAG: alpha/beta fold hydrolase [Gemmatimonadota bacterium]|nr:alpha/beta fold hydrolase [Gemmatimonadota bacterium]
MTAMITWAAVALLAGGMERGGQAPAQEPAPSVLEVRVDVPGGRMRALCTPGKPRVLFLHDEGTGAASWRPVLEQLTGIGACAYDRDAILPGRVPPEGLGWYEYLERLKDAHEALGVSEELVLVGNGVGAMYARLFAASLPSAVSGLVLVEPSHEDMPDLLRAAMPPEDWNEWMADRALPNEDGLRPAALAERARRARLPSIPVTVVTVGRRRIPPDWDARFVAEAARQTHEALVEGQPFGRHVPAPGSGPNVAQDVPALLVEEVERIVRIALGS